MATNRPWTNEEIDILLDNYFDGVGLKTISGMLRDRNLNAVTVKLSKMGMAWGPAERAYRQQSDLNRTGTEWDKHDKHLYGVWREKQKGGKEYIARVLRRSVFEIEQRANPRKHKKDFGL
jgi:hypothetical protein